MNSLRLPRRFQGVLVRHLVGADHIEARVREGKRNCSADPPSRTRDQGNLAIGQHPLPAGVAARAERDPDNPRGYKSSFLGLL
jgi:hypothetical protein